MAKGKDDGGSGGDDDDQRDDDQRDVTVEPDFPVRVRPDALPEDLIGSVLGGQYRIDAHLGAGGFGDVFRAKQEKTGQLVALKLLRPRYGKGAPSLERQRARFRREMRACGELHHPHIVRLLDSGETESSLLFSVFEYVPGVTLADMVRDRGALPVGLALELMGQVLDALICAHGKGVIHRDLKPNNIMVSTTGLRPQTTVLDFGISAFLEGMQIDDFTSLTMTRETLGTPSYAAPEQLRGELPSMKSDLYAWGLVLLECLLGRRVFDGTSAIEIAHRQLSVEPIALPERLNDHWLGVLLRWVLEKDVARRAGDGALLLERLLEKRPLGDVTDAQGYLIDGEVFGQLPDARRNAGPSTTLTAPAGERRQVTAVCCALSVGDATEAPAAGPLAPEVLDEALRDAQAVCLQIAARFGGHVAGNLGDQVMIYFGFPRAHESDLRRAALVGLEIVQAVRRRGSERVDVPLEVRVGIHTGIVTIPGLEDRTASPIFGVTPGQAARLAQEAPAGSILASAESAAHLSRSFEVEPVTLRRGQAAVRLLAESRAESATGGTHDRPAFLGRTRELDALRAAWRTAQEGRGGAVLLTGEAGIGKSRLARELRAATEDSNSLWLEARCLPEMQASALRPIIDLLVQELNLSATTGPDGAARLQTSLFELGEDPAEAMPLLCPWLALPLIEPYRPLPYSPQKQRGMLLDLLVRLLGAIGGPRPRVLLIEDLHWADPTTTELGQLLASRIADKPFLLLFTARPGTRLGTGSIARTLDLGTLDRADVEAMVKSLPGGDRLSSEMLDEAVRRSDGIPLYVEEIVRYLDRNANARGAGQGRDVPRSLRDLLTARLDDLGVAKDTAQLASVIGREFEYKLLASVYPGHEGALLADLDQMVSANLLMRRRHVDGPIYLFRHALIRDAAYESLLEVTRSDFHARLADAIEGSFADVVESRPELLAHHFAAGGDRRKAIGYTQRAAAQSLGRSAYHEALAHAERGVSWLDAYSDPRERAETELALNGLATPALMSTGGWAEETLKVKVERSQELVDSLGATPYAVPTLWGLAVYHHTRGIDRGRARTLVQRLLAMADEKDAVDLRVAALCMSGLCASAEGRLIEANDHLERALALYDVAAHRHLGRIYGVDPKMLAHNQRAWNHWVQGESDRAIEQAYKSFEWSRELNDAIALSMSSWYVALIHFMRGEAEKGHEFIAIAHDLATKHGLLGFLNFIVIVRGWGSGDADTAVSTLTAYEGYGQEYGLTFWGCLVAETEAAQGRYDDALRRLERSLERARLTGETYHLAEILRLKGRYLLARNPDEAGAARECFEEALALARTQSAALYERRASADLVELVKNVTNR